MRGLLEQNWSRLWTAEPGGPAHLHPGAFHQSVGLTEVENQLHTAIRKDAFASMRARTVVRPQVIDQPLQLTWPPDAVGPTTERRDTTYRLERERSDATSRIRKPMQDLVLHGWPAPDRSAFQSADRFATPTIVPCRPSSY